MPGAQGVSNARLHAVVCSAPEKPSTGTVLSPLRTLDVDVGEWSIPHTRKGGFFQFIFFLRSESS